MDKRLNTKFMLGNVKDWGKVLILMLDEVVIILAVLIIMYFLGMKITLSIKIGAAVVFVIFVFFRHVLVIPSFHRKQITGREGMIGEQGKAVEPLAPIGVVAIKGEYWSAKSINDRIETGEHVEIVGLEGLTLIVKRRNQ